MGQNITHAKGIPTVTANGVKGGKRLEETEVDEGFLRSFQRCFEWFRMKSEVIKQLPLLQGLYKQECVSVRVCCCMLG